MFRAAFINIGVSNCDMGTSWLLPRLIGASRSHELMLTGRRVDAQEALKIGLVADVVVDGDLAGRALQAAEQIATLAPWGVRLTKRGMWTALELPSEQAAIEFEDRQQIMSTFGVAVPEAIGAFLEKHGVAFDIIWNEDGRKGNLWATIGPADRRGVILSGHSDVVSVDGQVWTSDPFTVRQVAGHTKLALAAASSSTPHASSRTRLRCSEAGRRSGASSWSKSLLGSSQRWRHPAKSTKRT